MAKKRSLKGKGTYQNYRSSGRAEKNKVRKLESYIAKNPNDEQAKKALDRVLSGKMPVRQAPRSSVWTRKTIRLAQMFKKVLLNGQLALLTKPENSKAGTEYYSHKIQESCLNRMNHKPGNRLGETVV